MQILNLQYLRNEHMTSVSTSIRQKSNKIWKIIFVWIRKANSSLWDALKRHSSNHSFLVKCQLGLYFALQRYLSQVTLQVKPKAPPLNENKIEFGAREFSWILSLILTMLSIWNIDLFWYQYYRFWYCNSCNRRIDASISIEYSICVICNVFYAKIMFNLGIKAC